MKNAKEAEEAAARVQMAVELAAKVARAEAEKARERAEQAEIANAAAAIAAAKEAEQMLTRAEAEREVAIGSIESTTSQSPDPNLVLNMEKGNSNCLANSN